MQYGCLEKLSTTVSELAFTDFKFFITGQNQLVNHCELGNIVQLHPSKLELINCANILLHKRPCLRPFSLMMSVLKLNSWIAILLPMSLTSVNSKYSLMTSSRRYHLNSCRESVMCDIEPN
ncbi:unnamed protein product [Heterobilharzia americana]|nr:unnamed protein product [Heterobilharzia americana]